MVPGMAGRKDTSLVAADGRLYCFLQAFDPVTNMQSIYRLISNIVYVEKMYVRYETLYR
jgi:hypothetical protein